MGKVILEEQTGASTPASNKVAIYPKAGGGIYKKADDGVESLLATNQYIDTRLFGTVKAGSETLVSGTTSVTISYGSNFNDANYKIIATLQNTTDANPVVYDVMITGVTTSGFTATFASAMDSSNYKLNYYSTTASGVADQGGIDHGTLDGLTDDDHPQYVNNAEMTAADAVVTAAYTAADTTISGDLVTGYTAADAVVTAAYTGADTTISGDLQTNIDALTHDGFADFAANEHFTFASVSGTIDHDTITNFTSTEHFTEASIDHGAITGLSDNDHTQYVTGVSGSLPIVLAGQTIGFNYEGTDFSVTVNSISITDTGIDHDSTTNFVTNEHIDHTSVSITASGILSGGGTIVATRQIGLVNSDIDHDALTNYAADEHFTEASIDHGSIAGLSDNDHTQYVTGVSGSTPLRGGGQTLGFDESVIDHDALTNYSATEHVAEASIDHGTIAGLADNDHTQYVTGISGSTPLRGGGQTLGFDESVIDHDVLTNYSSNEHFTESSVDHGSIAGLSDIADHASYIVLDGTRAFTGNVQANASGTLDIGAVGTPFNEVFCETVNLKLGNAPATATSAGTMGDIAWDSSYIYVCVNTNVWNRTAISGSW